MERVRMFIPEKATASKQSTNKQTEQYNKKHSDGDQEGSQ